MITINQVTHNFGKKVLYNGINCVIGAHDRIALVGSNGSGKTTLLRMIMGEVDCDSGSFDKADYVSVGYLPQDGIHVHGKTLYAEAERLRRRTGIAGQDRASRCGTARNGHRSGGVLRIDRHHR